MSTQGRKPEVNVVIATRDRHDLLLKAINAVLAQDYTGHIRVTVVYDNHPMRPELAQQHAGREVVVVSNNRKPGLPGARNTGILSTDMPFVAFCDDDDMWRPGKLSAQLALLDFSGMNGCVSGIEVHYGERRIQRIPAVSRISASDAAADRMTGAHPSSYLFDHAFLVDRVGLVDEDIPFAYGEDYDLLLRWTGEEDLAVLQTAAVDVLWHPGGSYFSRRWEAMADGIEFLAKKHPYLGSTPKSRAWLQGQRAFALAALGTRRAEAVRTAREVLRLDPRQARGYLALAISAGLLKPGWVVDRLNARGRGI